MRKKAACFDKNILNIFATAVATGYNVTMENVRTGSCGRRMRAVSNIFLHKGAFHGFQNGALRQRTRRREFPQKPNLIFPHGFSRRIILCRQQTVCRAFQAARSGSFSSFWVIRTSSLSAAELIVERANADKEHMGLTTWENAPNGKIVKIDVSVAKNYLREKELEEMGRMVNAFLDMAESMAKRHIPMTMEDWARRIDKFINLFDGPILQDSGKVSAEYAKEFAESEFEKYRIIQDRLFQSDFDRFENDSLPPLDVE